MAYAVTFQLAALISWSVSTNSAIRLISEGLNNHCRKEGVLEFSNNSLIQYFNDSSNNAYRNARVACREMGYSSVASLTGEFIREQLEKEYYLHTINCTGEELRISDCPVEERVNIKELLNIGNTIRLLKISCAEFINVKLIGGNSENEGALLVFLNNIWGYVCDDDWNQVEANVVCRQLGYNSTSSSRNRYNTQHLLPHAKIVLDDMKCAGNESDILLCSHRQFGTSNCVNEEKIGIICQYTQDFSPQHNMPSVANYEDIQSGCDNGHGDNGDHRAKTRSDDNADQSSIFSRNSSQKNIRNIILLTAIPIAFTLLVVTVIVVLLLFKKKYRKRSNITDKSRCTPLIPLKEEQYL